MCIRDRFTVHETVEEPVAVPAGTQVFTPDGQGDNIVYETERAIEATPARLLDIYLSLIHISIWRAACRHTLYSRYRPRWCGRCRRIRSRRRA